MPKKKKSGKSVVFCQLYMYIIYVQPQNYVQNTFWQSENDSKWFLKTKQSVWHTNPPPPLDGKNPEEKKSFFGKLSLRLSYQSIKH